MQSKCNLVIRPRRLPGSQAGIGPIQAIIPGLCKCCTTAGRLSCTTRWGRPIVLVAVQGKSAVDHDKSKELPLPLHVQLLHPVGPMQRQRSESQCWCVCTTVQLYPLVLSLFSLNGISNAINVGGLPWTTVAQWRPLWVVHPATCEEAICIHIPDDRRCN